MSNLYPSEKDPTYGTFVKNFVDSFNDEANTDVDVCAIMQRSSSTIEKVYLYACFFLKTLWMIWFRKYDLIYVHYITNSAIAVRIATSVKNVPIAFNIHGDDLLTKSKWGEIALNFIRPILVKSKLIVVPSNFFKSLLLQKFKEINEGSVYVSASGGVKKNFYHEKIGKGKLCSIHLGYVSRIDKGKGWDTLIKASTLLQNKSYNVSLDIIGRGMETSMMEGLIESLNVSNAQYLGPIPYKELPKYYQSFDLFIFPTKLRESLGLVGLEAMANSTPVIGSAIGGLKDYIIDGYNGFLFEVGNEYELANKIIQFVELSAKDRATMSKNAYTTALGYSDSKVSSALKEKIYGVYKKQDGNI